MHARVRGKLANQMPAVVQDRFAREPGHSGDVLLDEFLQYTKKNIGQLKPEEFEKSKEAISHIIKANIASDIWGQNEFYEIMNMKEDSFTKAMEIINNWNNYLSLITP